MISVQTLLTIISVCAAVIFGYIAMQRGHKQDIESTTEERASINATILTKLDNISEDIADIKRDSRDTRTELQQLKERVAILEHGGK